MNKVELMASHQVVASDAQLALHGADGAMLPLSCTPAVAAYYIAEAGARAAAERTAYVYARGRFAAAEERVAGFDHTVDSLSVLALSRTRADLLFGQNG
jgi:hypothetical protein